MMRAPLQVRRSFLQALGLGTYNLATLSYVVGVWNSPTALTDAVADYGAPLTSSPIALTWSDAKLQAAVRQELPLITADTPFNTVMLYTSTGIIVGVQTYNPGYRTTTGPILVGPANGTWLSL